MAKRGPNGKFRPAMAEKPAVFASVGKGTCGFRNLVLVMDTAVTSKDPNVENKRGRRLEFGPDGKLETVETEVISFLEWKVKHPSPFSRITKIQEEVYEGEEKDKDKEKSKSKKK
jgi:hypothetical protein